MADIYTLVFIMLLGASIGGIFLGSVLSKRIVRYFMEEEKKKWR